MSNHLPDGNRQRILPILKSDIRKNVLFYLVLMLQQIKMNEQPKKIK